MQKVQTALIVTSACYKGTCCKLARAFRIAATATTPKTTMVLLYLYAGAVSLATNQVLMVLRAVGCMSSAKTERLEVLKHLIGTGHVPVDGSLIDLRDFMCGYHNLHA